MSPKHVFIALRLLCCGRLAAHAQAAAQPASQGFVTQEIAPALSTAPLVNPGMGLYLAGTLDPADMPPDAWFAPMLQIGYFRDDWAVLEPDAEGQYRFDAYFKPIFDLWVNRWRRRGAFRFMAENMHSQHKYVTPKWVFDQGVPFVKLKGLSTPEQIDPVFWDDHYLRIHECFIADLGKLGTWQRLIAYVETTPLTTGGQLAIEKGSLEAHNEINLQLDDVRLELLESP